MQASPNGYFNPRQGASAFQQVCQLVERMHSMRIAHLDLKPENVLVDSKGDLRLCDFGRAHQWTTETRRYDKFMSPVSTREYCSPERFSQDDFDVAAADIFSLGVILHVMMTGFFPWLTPKSGVATVFPLPLDLTDEDMEPDCLELLRWMLQSDPPSRPSIQQILAHKWLITKRL